MGLERGGKPAQRMCLCGSSQIYQAALQNLGPLQSHRDAVGEDEDEHHVVEELVGYDGLAHLPEPAGGGEHDASRRKQPS